MDLTPKYGFQLPSLDDLLWNEPTNENWELTELLISGTEALASGTQSALASHIIDTNDAHPATAISYDNASSGLTAENAQDAVDELKDITDQLNLDLGSYLPLSGGTMSGNILFPFGGLADGTNTVGFNLNGFTNSFAIDARTHAVTINSAPSTALILAVNSYRAAAGVSQFMTASSVAEARLSTAGFIIRANSNTPVADTPVSYTNWLLVDTNGLELQALKRIRIGTNDDYMMGWDGSGNRMLVRGLNGVLIQYRNAGVATNLVGFGSTAANFLTPITFSGDTNIYRNAANELKTDDSFIVGDTLIAPTSTGFNTKSTGTTEMGFWYPLGTFSITAASGRVHGQLSLTRNGGNTGDININAFCLLNFSVKQTTMNTPPDVTLTVPFAEGSYYDQNNLALVVTQNDATATVATLYVKSEASFERHTYSFSNVRKLGTATFTAAPHESNGTDTLPSGTTLVPAFSIAIDPLDGTVNAPAFVGDGAGLSGVEKTANKNQANGYAGLDSNGKVHGYLIPVISGTVYSINGVNPDEFGNVALTPADIGAAEDSHDHGGTYSLLGHNHDGSYSPLGHNHDSSYAAKSLETDFASLSGTVAAHSVSIAQLESDVSGLETSKQDTLGYTPENQANRGIAGGYAPLGFDGKVPVSHLPAIAINETFVVSGTAEMIALTAERGDVAVRTDENKSYILKTDDPSLASNWQELLTPTDAVNTVNGQSGNVVLTTSDIGEGSNLYHTTSRVQTVGDSRYLQLTGGSLTGTLNNTGASSAADIYTAKVSGDTINRFSVKADGKTWWGDGVNNLDTNLYRSGAGVLRTDGVFQIGGGLQSLSTGVSSFMGPVTFSRAAVGQYGWSLYVTGDTQARYAATVTGIVEWGDGTSTRDTNLYRSSANTLKTDDAFEAVSGKFTDLFVGSLNGTVDYGLSTRASTRNLSFEGYAGVRFKYNCYFDGSTVRFMNTAGGTAYRYDMLSGGLTAQASTNTVTADAVVTFGNTFWTLNSTSATFRRDTNASASLYIAQNRDTGTSAAINWTSQFADTSGTVMSGSVIRTGKSGAWTNGSPTTQNAFWNVRMLRDGAETDILNMISNGDTTLWHKDSITTGIRSRVTGEAGTRFYIRADGRMQWGDGTNTTDTFLYRAAPGALETTASITASVANTTSPTNYSKVTGETLARHAVLGDGKHEWGDGTNTRDVNLYRSAANVLKTDDSLHIDDNLHVDQGFYTKGYVTDTLGGTANKWLQVLKITLSAQYDVGSAAVQIMRGGNNGATNGSVGLATLQVRLKQQNTMSGSPYAELLMPYSSGIDPDDVKFVITTDDNTTKEGFLYVRQPSTYDNYHYSILSAHAVPSGAITPLNDVSAEDNLPSGTVVSCVNGLQVHNTTGAVTAGGDITANSFYGSGENLTGVDAETLDGLNSTDFAAATHNHDGVYATASHNHDGVYAAVNHNHDAVYRKKTDTAYVEMFAVADLASLSSGEIMDYRIISGGAKNIGKVVISSLTTPGSGGIEIDIKIKTTPAATATSIFTTTPVLTGNGGINWMTVTTNFDTSTIPDDAMVILEIVSADGGSDLRVEIYE